MERVGPTDPVTGSGPLELFAARNEWEPFQVVVSARGGDLAGVDATLSPFVGPGGAVFSSVSMFREHYAEITQPSPFSQYPPGWHPDALIPFTHPETGQPLAGARFDAVPFDLVNGHNQPLWIEIFVPPETVPGTYIATLQVTAGTEVASLPVQITVWDFTLPVTPGLRSAFWMGDYQMSGAYDLDWNVEPALLYQITRRYYDVLLDHRLMPTRPVDVNPAFEVSTGEPVFNVLYPGLATAAENLAHYLGDDEVTATNSTLRSFWPFSDPLGADRAAARHFTGSVLQFFDDSGWRDRSYAYLVDLDEPSSAAEYDELRDWGQFFDETEAESGLEIPMLVTAHPTSPVAGWGTLVGAADIWVPCCDSMWVSEDFYDHGVIAERLADGDEVWWYTALTRASPEWWAAHGFPTSIAGDNAPIWQIDFAPLNLRIAPWFAPHYGFTGILYWQIAAWNEDPWTDPGNFVGGGLTYNGDGMLVYPGLEDEIGFDGPAPSLRLKWLRQGMEDYEYIRLLNELGDGDFALAQIQTAARDMGDWEEDPAVWLAARRAMGERLDAHGAVFSDGFDSGDTSVWSTTVP